MGGVRGGGWGEGRWVGRREMGGERYDGRDRGDSREMRW